MSSLGTVVRLSCLAKVRAASRYACLLAVAAVSLMMASPAPAAGAGSSQSPAVVSVLWTWQETLMNDGATVAPDDPARYTLELLTDGRVAVRADCNRGVGSYTLEGNRVTVGPLAVTRAACPPGSLGDTFLTQLGAAAIYFTRGPQLYLDLAVDSGTMRFAPPVQVGAGSGKISFDLAPIDDTGLTGPPNGRVAVAYEFCIPATSAHLAEVQRIDPTARAQPSSRGRIGCRPGAEVLFIGSTHQPAWLTVLQDLAALDYLVRIDRHFAE